MSINHQKVQKDLSVDLINDSVTVETRRVIYTVCHQSKQELEDAGYEDIIT